MRVGFIGAGNMAGALARGWGDPVLATDAGSGHAAALAAELGGEAVASNRELAKRLIDFASGLTYALDGGMQKIADKTFLLTPRNVEVSAEERARLVEKGFFNQS